MTPLRVAILIDGGFFLHRLPKIVGAENCATPTDTVQWITRMCRAHIQNLTGEKKDARWLRHVYRIFYYDAAPYDGKSHHPLLNQPVDFAKSELAAFRRGLFDALKRQRKVALRLGKVVREGNWTVQNHRMKKLLATRAWLEGLDFSGLEGPAFTPEQLATARRLQNLWVDIEPGDAVLPLRQKGVDMRIGIDIASISLKRQADTIILVAGDSDFVPAAKLARREGMEIILDPLWQNIHDDLFEHIDGLHSGLYRGRAGEPPRGEAPEDHRGDD